MSRRDKDFYPTPEWATRALLQWLALNRRPVIFECCSGDDAIADVLRVAAWPHHVFTNDIDPARPAQYNFDMTSREAWIKMCGDAAQGESVIDWVISNPPFNVAPQIVPLAFEFARRGVAMLLRLSYLEPCDNRAAWLAEHPPTHLFVLPRISFTGDGKTDNVTCAWVCWDKSATTQRIVVVPKRAAPERLEVTAASCAGLTPHEAGG